MASYAVKHSGSHAGFDAPSHLALPCELSDHINWVEQLENDKSRLGIVKYYAFSSMQVALIAIQMMRYYVVILVFALAAYEDFVRNQNPHQAFWSGFTASGIAGFFVEIGYLFARYRSTIYVPVIRGRAYVSHGPISIYLKVYTVLIGLSIIIAGSILFDKVENCSTERTANFTVQFDLCNN